MKKKILVILMVLVFAMVPLTGCENSFSGLKLSKAQDTSYIVEGNGSNAVQYGNFVYFINGHRGYSDTEADSNIWPDVVKGALYRVELLGSKNDKRFDKTIDAKTGLGFSSSPFVLDFNEEERFLTAAQFDMMDSGNVMFETDYNLERINNEDYEEDIVEEFFYKEDLQYRVDNVERVAAKTIGTSGYAEGGIFIFDNYVYYASPNNQRDKSGTVQTNKTDFFRTKINGTKTKTEKIYTTSSDSASAPYKFYKQGGHVFLNVLDGTEIISIKMNDRKVVGRHIIAEDVTGAYFPTKSIYDSKNNITNGVEDYIYYTRAVNDDDGAIKTGNVIEAMRPNGTQRFELVKNGAVSSVDSVRDGLVFYRTVNQLGRTEVRYTNMYDAIYEYNDGDCAYTELVTDVALSEVDTETIYCFRPGAHIQDNNVHVLIFADDGVYISDTVTKKQIVAGGGNTFAGMFGNDVYYYNSAGAYYYANAFTPVAENTPVLIEEQGATAATIQNSFVAGYFVFMGAVDAYASAYTKFYPIGEDGAKSIFVGKRIDDDMKQLPQEA